MWNLHLRTLAFSALIAAGLTAAPLYAQTQPVKAPANKKPDNSAARRLPNATKVIITPERQAAALKFAELHHPELFELVKGLRKARRAAYEKAVRQLYNDSERLARLKERVPSRYELALTEWQLDSRLRLLVARITMSAGDPEMEAQLRELLKKRLEARLALLKLDRERQAARLKKLDEQIEEIEADENAAIDKDLVRIQRSLGVRKRPAPGKRPTPRKYQPAKKAADPKKSS